MKARYTDAMLGATAYKKGTPYGFMRKGTVFAKKN